MIDTIALLVLCLVPFVVGVAKTIVGTAKSLNDDRKAKAFFKDERAKDEALVNQAVWF